MGAAPRYARRDFLQESFLFEDLCDGVRKVTAELKAQLGKHVNCAYCFAGPKHDSVKAQAWLAAKQIQYAKLDPAKNDTYRQITAKGANPQRPDLPSEGRRGTAPARYPRLQRGLGAARRRMVFQASG